MKSALITIAVLVLTPLLLRWLLGVLRRRFPAAPRSSADAGIERLRPAYRTLVKRTILLWFLVAAALGVLFAWLLAEIGAGRETQLGSGAFFFVPDWPLWVLPALFLALAAASLLTEGVVHLILGSRYESFARLDELEHGFSGDAAIWAYAVIASIGLALSLALWDHYVVAGETGLRINGFLSAGERRCDYRELTAITTAPGYVAGWWVFAGEHPRRHYRFEFTDGCVFSTRSAPRGIPLEERARLADFVVARSGVQITELPALIF